MAEGVNVHGGFQGGTNNWDDPDGVYDDTIIDGDDDETHAVSATGFTVGTKTTLDGFQITGGLADGGSGPNSSGGGIYVAGNNTVIRLEYVHVIDNTADGPSADGQGGGIYHTGAGLFECVWSHIEGNYAQTGGGFFTESSDANDFSNTVFDDNGGISVPEDKPSTADGGAIWMTGANLTMYNGLMNDNEALDEGAAIYWDATGGEGDNTLELRHCTLAFNSTAQAGGGTPTVGSGIHVTSGSSGHTLQIANSILWDEDPGYDIYRGTGGSGQVTMDISFSDVGDSYDAATTTTIAYGTGMITPPADPQFVDESTRDLRLDGSGPSPCIETASFGLIPQDLLDIDADGITTGPSGELLPWDLIRERRAIDFDCDDVSTPDMGAYETSSNCQ